MSAAAVSGLTRAELPARIRAHLRAGRGTTPDVWLVETAEGLVVVKDCAGRPRGPRRAMARWRLRREMRALAALADHPDVPRLEGPVDAFAFAMEHRPGFRFSRRRPWLFGPGFAERLERAVEAMHARGVVHLDLAHRGNVRAGPDGEPVLVDLGAAVCLRPGGFAARLLLPLLARVDRRALRKWRARAEAQRGPGSAGGDSAPSSGGGRGASRPT